MDILMPRIKGIYRDCLYGADGALLYDSGWRNNTIVNSCRVLLARLMMNKDGAGGGIFSLKVGQGNPAWDQVQPPDVDPTTTALSDLSPYEFTAIKLEYLQPNTSDTSITPTNCLQITVEMPQNVPEVPNGQAAYSLREFGLFGHAGDNTPYMIDCVRHALIQKDSTMTLTRVIRLIF